MYPIICKIGPFPLYAFGLMFALSILICGYLLAKDAAKHNIQSQKVYDLILYLAIAGIVGARVFHIAINLDYYSDYKSEVLMIQNGGLAWQGGLIFASLFGIFFIKRMNIKLPLMLDLTAPYIALGQSIGRIGCFLNGCCYGKKATWGIFFPVHEAHLHPTQLYSTIGLFTIFILLKKYQKTAPYQGAVFVRYLLLAPALRFVIEFFRADHYTTFFGLSIFQLVCIAIIMVSFYVNSKLSSRRKLS